MKKILTSLLLAVIIFSSVPKNVNAEMTVAEIMAQIAALQAQLAQMQGQPTVPTPTGGGSGGGGVMSTCPIFSRSLTIGSTGADVTNLQKFLMAKGYLSQENISGYFGPLTRVALTNYQVARGISPATGYFGSLTIAAVNAECNTTQSAKVSIALMSSDAEIQDEKGLFTIKFKVTALSGNVSFSSNVFKAVNYSMESSTGEYIDNSPVLLSPSGSVDQRGYFEILEGDTETFTLSVVAYPQKTLTALLSVKSLNFLDDKNVSFSSNVAFKTNYLTIKGSPVDQNGLKVISPKAGEKLVKGQTHRILWSGWDIYNGTKITEYSVYLVGGSLGSNGSRFLGTVDLNKQDWFEWRVPSNLEVSSDYQIQFSGKYATGDNSDSFSIVSDSNVPIPAPFLKVLSPNGGEKIIKGQSYLVKWSRSNIPSNTYPEIYVVNKDTGKEYMIRANSEEEFPAGSFNWPFIGLGLGETEALPSGSYKIKIVYYNSNNPTKIIEDWSDGYFKIVSEEVYPQVDNVKVLYNGSQVSQIITGNKYTIAWEEKNTSSGLKTKVRLDWLNSKREWVSTYEIGSVPGSGSGKNSITWSVPLDLKIFDGRYKVYVEHPGAGGSQEVQLSNQEASPRSSISISSPNSADLVIIGSKVKVEWTTVNIPVNETFLIRLRSVSTGQEYNLVSGVLNDQSENVVISPTLPEGYYKLEIKSSKSILGTSGAFKVSSPTTTVQPASLEVWGPWVFAKQTDRVIVGDVAQFTSTKGDSSYSYSCGSDGKLVINPLNPNGITHGTFYCQYSSAGKKDVKILLNGFPLVSKQIEVFPIASDTTASLPTVKVLDPNTSQNLVEGSIFTIKWTATDAATVDLRLYHSETSTYDIVKGIPNTGSYNWKVSRMGTGQRGTYAIGVRAINGSVSAYDTSDQQFSIVSSGMKATLISTDTDASTGVSTNDDVGLFTIRYKVEAIGKDIYIPASTAAASYVVDKAGLPVTSSAISATFVNITDSSKTPNGNYVIKNGEEKTFELAVSVPMGGINTSGQYRLSINGLRWRDTDTTGSPNTHTASLGDFRTSYKVLNYGDRASQIASIQATLNTLIEALKNIK